MTERTFNIIPKPVRPAVYVGLAFAGMALMACGGGNNGADGNHSAQAGPDILPTVAPTRIIEPTAIPTPERLAFNFGNYDVFVGDIKGEGGGKIVMVVLADAAESNKGTVIVASGNGLACLVENKPANYRYITAVTGSYRQDSFDFSTNIGIKFTGKAESPEIISGSITGPEMQFRTFEGKLGTCPAANLGFTAARIGNGRKPFLDSYKTGFLNPFQRLFGLVVTNPGEGDLLADVQRRTGIALP